MDISRQAVDLNLNHEDYAITCKKVCENLGVEFVSCGYGLGLSYYAENCLWSLPDFLVRKLSLIFKEHNVR